MVMYKQYQGRHAEEWLKIKINFVRFFLWGCQTDNNLWKERTKCFVAFLSKTWRPSQICSFIWARSINFEVFHSKIWKKTWNATLYAYLGFFNLKMPHRKLIFVKKLYEKLMRIQNFLKMYMDGWVEFRLGKIFSIDIRGPSNKYANWGIFFQLQ